MKKSVLCFGEVLWDVLPSGKKAGGAPMNVAFHCNNMGLDAYMISKVGDDDLGVELLDFFSKKGISTDLVQKDKKYPTGIVNVELDEKGSPSYEIVAPAAWDHILTDEEIVKKVSAVDVFIFGSLSTRNEVSRNTLLTLLEQAQLKVLDVNLRIPFYSREIIELLLSKADVVKMNDEELELIADWLSITGDDHSQAVAIAKQYQLMTLIVTKGGDGAFCVNKGAIFTHGGFPVIVNDTIGSGDSFLAAFLSKMLAEESPSSCLEFACATGAFVASQKGGTPLTSPTIIQEFMNK